MPGDGPLLGIGVVPPLASDFGLFSLLPPPTVTWLTMPSVNPIYNGSFGLDPDLNQEEIR